MVFLGASYFRLLGRGHLYGLSSRGLAVDVGLDRGEEFPAFREFWLVRPEPDAATLTFYALLDSPSVTGAYRFDLAPGAPTTLGVDARLHARRDIDKLGVAPMSSMFLYDQNQRPRFDDFRPQVHDSDGLLVRTADDEWIWRPLNNTLGVQVTTVHDETPRGFGLVQRDRRFDNYLDLEASYHRRPSEWVALDLDEGDWGCGRCRVVDVPHRLRIQRQYRCLLGARPAIQGWRRAPLSLPSDHVRQPARRADGSPGRAHAYRLGCTPRRGSIPPRVVSGSSSSTSVEGTHRTRRPPRRSRRWSRFLPVRSPI